MDVSVLQGLHMYWKLVALPLHHKQNQTFTLSVYNSSMYNIICCKPCPQNHRKIPEKSKLLLEFPIGLHYKDLNQKFCLK